MFTDHVFGAMKENDMLKLEGPFGTFFLREDSDKPIVLLAGGTGFAPIKSIIEYMNLHGIRRPVRRLTIHRRDKQCFAGPVGLALFMAECQP